MAVLILNVGGSQITVPCQKAGKGKPFDVGEKTRASAGNERSSITKQKRAIPVVTSPLDMTTEAAIQTLIANGAQFPCQGDVFNNASANVTCSAECSSSEMVVGGLFWVMTLILTEV